MRDATDAEWARYHKNREVDDGPDDGIRTQHRGSGQMLEKFNEQLRPFGLQVISYEGSSDAIWRLERIGDGPVTYARARRIIYGR